MKQEDNSVKFVLCRVLVYMYMLHHKVQVIMGVYLSESLRPHKIPSWPHSMNC